MKLELHILFPIRHCVWVGDLESTTTVIKPYNPTLNTPRTNFYNYYTTLCNKSNTQSRLAQQTSFLSCLHLIFDFLLLAVDGASRRILQPHRRNRFQSSQCHAQAHRALCRPHTPGTHFPHWMTMYLPPVPSPDTP